MSDNYNIKRGIFQGDSSPPLLFFMPLIPLSLELTSPAYGYKIRTDRVSSHPFVLYDDLKLYAKGDSELEGLRKIEKEFSDDIGMEFRLRERQGYL